MLLSFHFVVWGFFCVVLVVRFLVLLLGFFLVVDYTRCVNYP